jgi:hypothetical protein
MQPTDQPATQQPPPPPTATPIPATAPNLQTATLAPPADPPTRTASPFSIEILKLVDQDKQAVTIKALIDVETERQTFEMDQRRARSFAESGLFADIKGVGLNEGIARAMTKIQMGREWGLSRADSMKNVYFINGKPALENACVASALQEAGYAWQPEWTFEDTKDDKGKPWRKCTGCTLWILFKGQPMLDRKGQQVSVSFTAMQAEHAEVYEGGGKKKLSEKFNYMSFGEDMYYWRCISRLHKYYAPAVLRGGRLKEYEDVIEPEESSALTVVDEPNPTLREIVLDAKE